jgi:iron complex transport system ATP-binding protein
MAIVYCDRVIVLDNGKIVGEGKPKDVLTEKLLKEMYGVDANIIYNEYLKRNIIVFKSKYE